MDGLKESLFHCVPFLSLLTSNPPQNRPLLTRLSEQTLVGIVAAFVALQAMQARQAEQINELRVALKENQRLNEDARRELRDELAAMRRDLYAPKK